VNYLLSLKIAPLTLREKIMVKDDVIWEKMFASIASWQASDLSQKE
jgi:hypothetical protein